MFGVIKVHNFDAETEACLFDKYEDAQNYLLRYWEEYYNEEKNQKSWLNEPACCHGDDYGIVKWEDGCRTEFILFEVSEPREF